MVEGKDQDAPWRHATHVSIRSDTSSGTCSPRKKGRKHQVSGSAPGHLRSNLKRGLPATRHLLAIFTLLYLGAWGYWVALYRKTPSRKCSARLDGLAVDANLRQHNLARRALYDSLEARLESEGLNIGKEQTQGLDSRSLFRVRDGRVEPALQPLAVPVRSIVIPLGEGEARERLASAVMDHILPMATEAGIWLQDPKKYHSTVFHASPHQHPVKASTAEVAVEMTSVSKAAMMLCPLEIALERITVTATGNVIACWQMADGSDPSEVRRALERALPNAPQHAYQTIQDPAILHTTLARLLKPIRAMPQDQVAGRMLRGGEADQVATLQSAVGRMTESLCGLRLTLRALWYVQEDDLLALALSGRSRQQEVPLLCQDPPPTLTSNIVVRAVHHAPPVIKDASYLE